MEINSFENQKAFNDDRINTSLILETPVSKEIRILLKTGQIMKEHKAPYPIVIHILHGEVQFGVQGDTHSLIKGDIISLESNVPHDLKALQDSAVRLTLSKMDTAERVSKVAGS